MKSLHFALGAVLLVVAMVVAAPVPMARAESEPVVPVLECSELEVMSALEVAAGPGAAADCIPRDQCCKVCSQGTACGNTCTKSAQQCRKPRGCACSAKEVCR
jgi:hypothetical protein